MLKGIPFLSEGQIVFPEGSISVHDGKLGELQKLLGHEGYFDQTLPPQANHRCFVHSQGKVIALFKHGVELGPESEIMTIDYILDIKRYLLRFQTFYQVQSSSLPCILLESGKLFAIFGLNLHLTCLMKNHQVESLSFVSSKHINNCSCEVCALIRQIVADNRFLPPVRQGIQLIQ